MVAIVTLTMATIHSSPVGTHEAQADRAVCGREILYFFVPVFHGGYCG